MSWLSKLCVLVLVHSFVSVATPYHFGGQGSAHLETRLLANRRAPASIEFRLSLPGLSLEASRDGFHELKVSGLTPLNAIGSPSVQTTGLLLAVPAGYEPRVTIESEEQREIADILLAPAQHKFRCSGGRDDGFQFNANLYASDDIFPAAPAMLEDVGKIQDIRMMRLGLYPVRNHLGKKLLQVTTYLKGRLDFVPMGEGVRPFQLSGPMGTLVRQIAVNGEDLVSRVEEAQGETMVIITADSLKSAISSLVEWKQAKGIRVTVVTLTEAGGTKEKVKEYLQKFYDAAATKPAYFLFVGNKTTLPTFMESTSSGSAASDYRYSLLSGNDRLPDVFFGRIIADSEFEVANQIQRWIAYEKTPDRNATWYKMGTTIASNEGSGPSDQEYAEMIQAELKKNTYTAVDPFYQGTSMATFSNISNGLKEGRSWLAYFGHGSGTSWGSTNDTFSNAEVLKIENGNRLPIVIDVACLNTSWVNLGNPFGKVWVNASKNGVATGAVAFYGGSVSISWHEPAVMSVGVAKYHFEKPVYTLGGSVLAGQLHLVEKMGTGENVWDNFEWYNLFGDPSMLVRTDTPATYQVSQSIVTSDRAVSIQVTAQEATGKGVENLLVSVRGSNGNPIALGKTNANGQADLTVSGIEQLEPGTILTTTGYNKDTVQQSLQ